MKLSDLEDLNVIDEMIVGLQEQLSDLYKQRISIVRASDQKSKKSRKPSITTAKLSGIDLSLDDTKPFRLG